MLLGHGLGKPWNAPACTKEGDSVENGSRACHFTQTDCKSLEASHELLRSDDCLEAGFDCTDKLASRLNAWMES